MKIIHRLLLVLHVFVGLGAIGGGLMAILNPQSPGGMSVENLKNSPFTDFLIPGIILFVVIGLGNLLAAATILLKTKYQGYISSVFGWGLMIWIVVQCVMLQAIVSLHVIFFCFGLVQAALAMAILFLRRQFPANIALTILNACKKKLGWSQVS